MYFILKINGVCLLKFINSDILYFIKSLQCCTLEFFIVAIHNFSFDNISLVICFIFNSNNCLLVTGLKLYRIFTDMA